MRAGELVVTHLDQELVRPSAVSLRLGSEAFVLRPRGTVDVVEASTYPELEVRPPDARGRLVVRPGEVLLARTRECIGLSTRLAGLIDGTSDWARLGVSMVLCHQVSPGYGMPDGAPLTLEITSRLAVDVLLTPGIRVANLMVFRGARSRRAYAEMPAHHSTAQWSVGSRLAEAEAHRLGILHRA